MTRRRRNRRAESGISGLQLLVLVVIIILGAFLVLRANPALASRLPPDMQRVIDGIHLPRQIHIPTGIHLSPSSQYTHYDWQTDETNRILGLMSPVSAGQSVSFG